MNWFLIALITPIAYSITNHIDKYLLSKYFHNYGATTLLIFSGLIGLLVLPVVAIFYPQVLTSFEYSYLLISLNGVLFLVALIPHLIALQKDETSLVVPLFQMIPVFTYLLGFLILGELLTVNQIVGGLIIIAGSIFISLDLEDLKKIKLKWDILWLMALSSFLFSLTFILFKNFTLETNFWIASFWEHVGFILFAFFIIIFSKKSREGFMEILRESPIKVIGINTLNEILNVIGTVAVHLSSLLVPVALVTLVNGFQPFFVFVLGILITLFFPRLGTENISRRRLVHKFLAIMVILVGGYLIN